MKLFASWIVTALAYLATAWLSRFFVPHDQTLAPIYLPAGVGLAVLLLWGKKRWPGILLGALAVYFSLGIPWIEAGFAAAAETITAILAAALILGGIGDDFDLGDVRAIGKFLTSVFAAGLLGTLLVMLGPFTVTPLTALTWWQAQIGGMLLLAPLLLAWLRPRTLRFETPVLLETVLLTVLVSASGFLVFGPWLPPQISISLPFVAMLWMIWPAVHLNFSVTVHTTCLLSLMALVSTAWGSGPFGALPPDAAMWSLQFYVIVLSSLSLLLGQVIPASRWRRQELEKEFAEMTQREQASTQALKQSRADLLALLENTDYSIWSVDRDMRVVTFNSHFAKDFEESFGFALATGQSTLNLLPTDTASSWHGFYERALSGKSFSVDYPSVRDQQINYYKISFYPIHQAERVTGVSVFSRDVTETQVLLNELSASEARWRAIVENAPMMITLLDPDGKILTINRPFWPRLTTEDLIGESIYRYLPENEQAQTRKIIQEVSDTAQPAYFELSFYHDNNALNWIANHVAPVIQDGHVRALIFLTTNITSQKAAQQAIQDSEQRLREIIEAAPFGAHSYELQSDGRLIFNGYNPAADRILGIDHVGLIGKTIEDAFPNLANTAIPARYRQIAAHDVRINDEQVTYDGREIQGTFEIHAFQSAPNRMSVFFRDITERMKAEIALRQNQAALAKAQQIAHLGSYELDLVTGQLTWSQEVFHIWGLNPQEQPSYEWVVQHIHLADRPLVIEQTYQSRDQAQSFQIDYRIQHEDGSIRWLHDVAEIVADENADSPKIFGIVLDITERMKAEEEIIRMNAELEERVRARTAELEEANEQLAKSNQELESFSYSVSHDLRSPLRAIDGYAHILLEDHGPNMPPDSLHLLDAIRRNAQQMGQLIDDLLAFAKLGRQPIRQIAIDMDDLCDQARLTLKGDLTSRKVQLTRGQLPTCLGDPALLRQVWLNLLSNALKFTREQPDAQIEIKGWQAADEVIYCVRDNGSGFDMRYANKLFGVFQRLHSSEKYEGTGVGLAIIERIIHKHEGRVWAEGQVAHGATFYFSLPKPIHPSPTEK